MHDSVVAGAMFSALFLLEHILLSVPAVGIVAETLDPYFRQALFC